MHSQCIFCVPCFTARGWNYMNIATAISSSTFWVAPSLSLYIYISSYSSLPSLLLLRWDSFLSIYTDSPCSNNATTPREIPTAPVVCSHAACGLQEFSLPRLFDLGSMVGHKGDFQDPKMTSWPGLIDSPKMKNHLNKAPKRSVTCDNQMKVSLKNLGVSIWLFWLPSWFFSPWCLNFTSKVRKRKSIGCMLARQNRSSEKSRTTCGYFSQPGRLQNREISGVIILPSQTRHFFGGNPSNFYHRFALFDSPKHWVISIMIPEYRCQ